jgi:hypothetical protein
MCCRDLVVDELRVCGGDADNRPQAIYLTLFYTKREYALRIGYLFVSAAIAGSLGGIFAYG